MTRDEIDILRSAIVLTSSGLDASMKRLVHDVGRFLIGNLKTGARAQYEQYLKRALSEPSTPSGLRNAVVSSDPGSALLDYYLSDRTKASFQGSDDLKSRVRSVLGIGQSQLPNSALEALDPFFTARNQIVHDMDYRDPRGTSTARIHRGIDDVTEMCTGAFDTAMLIIASTAAVLRAAR
jgi:hypothetical protein